MRVRSDKIVAMRWLKYFVWGVILLLAGGAILQALASSRSLHRPPGSLVDVGGYRMHLYCTGQGAPTVILDAGFGDSWMTWRTVQPRIAQFTRVCSYDRAGMGWSDPSPNPRTSRAIAAELHTLLHNASIPPPYLLLGHSFGGLNVRAYADAYREDVAALMLEDSAHPDQTARLPEALKKFEGRFEILLHAGVYSMPFGLPRMIGFCDPDATAECSSASMREMEAERAALDESSAEVRAAHPLGNLPLLVLSRDPSNVLPALPPDVMKSANEVWQQLQKELAQLSTDSAHVIATGSGHYIHREKPDLFVATVRDLVAKLR
jgi:pimeloyl-ACP methyl ester carboxylesterase